MSHFLSWAPDTAHSLRKVPAHIELVAIGVSKQQLISGISCMVKHTLATSHLLIIVIVYTIAGVHGRMRDQIGVVAAANDLSRQLLAH